MVGGRLRGRASARGDNMRRVRGNVRLSLGAAVLLGSAMLGILAFSGPAAATAVLMVSPSTGLTNGQSVNVTASGFAASSPGAVLECNNDAGQPTVSVPGNAIPVSCTNPLLTLKTTDASGNLATTFSIVTGVTGPPGAGTDSGGGSAATDAANYPCPPTAAQVTAGDSCVIAFGSPEAPSRPSRSRSPAAAGRPPRPAAADDHDDQRRDDHDDQRRDDHDDQRRDDHHDQRRDDHDDGALQCEIDHLDRVRTQHDGQPRHLPERRHGGHRDRLGIRQRLRRRAPRVQQRFEPADSDPDPRTDQ